MFKFKNINYLFWYFFQQKHWLDAVAIAACSGLSARTNVSVFFVLECNLLLQCFVASVTLVRESEKVRKKTVFHLKLLSLSPSKQVWYELKAGTLYFFILLLLKAKKSLSCIFVPSEISRNRKKYSRWDFHSHFEVSLSILKKSI